MARALCRSLLSSLFLLKYTEVVGKGQHTCKAVDLEIITDLKPAAVETGAEAEGVAGSSTLGRAPLSVSERPGSSRTAAEFSGGSPKAGLSKANAQSYCAGTFNLRYLFDYLVGQQRCSRLWPLGSSRARANGASVD